MKKATEDLTICDMDNLRHMLGVNERTPRGYRNYFVAGVDNAPSMKRLERAGFVVRNERYRLSAEPCYHATLQGAQMIGLRELPR